MLLVFTGKVLYREGMKIKAIQEKTRHANIDVLVKHYIHDEESIGPYFDKILREEVGVR